MKRPAMVALLDPTNDEIAAALDAVQGKARERTLSVAAIRNTIELAAEPALERFCTRNGGGRDTLGLRTPNGGRAETRRGRSTVAVAVASEDAAHCIVIVARGRAASKWGSLRDRYNSDCTSEIPSLPWMPGTGKYDLSTRYKRLRAWAWDVFVTQNPKRLHEAFAAITSGMPSTVAERKAARHGA